MVRSWTEKRTDHESHTVVTILFFERSVLRMESRHNYINTFRCLYTPRRFTNVYKGKLLKPKFMQDQFSLSMNEN